MSKDFLWFIGCIIYGICGYFVGVSRIKIKVFNMITEYYRQNNGEANAVADKLLREL